MIHPSSLYLYPLASPGGIIPHRNSIRQKHTFYRVRRVPPATARRIAIRIQAPMNATMML